MSDLPLFETEADERIKQLEAKVKELEEENELLNAIQDEDRLFLKANAALKKELRILISEYGVSANNGCESSIVIATELNSALERLKQASAKAMSDLPLFETKKDERIKQLEAKVKKLEEAIILMVNKVKNDGYLSKEVHDIAAKAIKAVSDERIYT